MNCLGLLKIRVQGRSEALWIAELTEVVTAWYFGMDLDSPLYAIS